VNGDEAVALLQRLQGPALHCLAALLIGHLVKGADVVTDENVRVWAAKSQDSVNRGMATLRSVTADGVPMVEQVGRNPNRWRLTVRARQLVLPLAGLFETPQKTESLGSSSSYESIKLTDSSNELLLLPPETPQKTESCVTSPQISPLSPQVSPQAVGLLVKAGCSEAKARAAVVRALERGESVAGINARIAWGLSYAASPAGRGLRAVGYWLAAVVADGREIQAVTSVEGDLSGYEGYKEGQEGFDVPDE